MPSLPPPPPPPRRGISTGKHRIQREAGGSVHAAPTSGELEHFVRINPAGEVIAAHGAAQRLASLSTYICSLADTIGTLLDIGPCQVVEATYVGGRLITVREPDGSIVGLKPHVSATQPIVRVGAGR